MWFRNEKKCKTSSRVKAKCKPQEVSIPLFDIQESKEMNEDPLPPGGDTTLCKRYRYVPPQKGRVKSRFGRV